MIEFYAEHDPVTGQVFQCIAIERPYEGSFMESGRAYLAIAEPVDWSKQPTPTSEMRIVGGKPQWVDLAAMEQAHAEAWASIKQARDKAEAAPFEFEGGMYDPNKENVSGAALAALLAHLSGQEVTRTWTLADNSRRELTGAQIISLGLTLTARVDAIHETGRQLRDQLSAILAAPGATPADLYAVKWPTEEPHANQ